MVCVILNADKGHYDLGALRRGDRLQVVFEIGEEWEAAELLLLAFMKSHAPARGEVGLAGATLAAAVRAKQESEKE